MRGIHLKLRHRRVCRVDSGRFARRRRRGWWRRSRGGNGGRRPKQPSNSCPWLLKRRKKLKLGSSSLGLSHTTESLREALFRSCRVVLDRFPLFVHYFTRTKRNQFLFLPVINRSVHFLNTLLDSVQFD